MLTSIHVGEVSVIPVTEGRKRVFMGPATVPLVHHAFMMRMNMGGSWEAQIEAARIAAAFAEVGAAGLQSEAWGMVCAKHHLYFGPLQAR